MYLGYEGNGHGEAREEVGTNAVVEGCRRKGQRVRGREGERDNNSSSPHTHLYTIHTIYYTIHTIYLRHAGPRRTYTKNYTHHIPYTLYTIHTIYYTHCIPASCGPTTYIHYILYTLYTIHTIYYTHYILYTLYTIHTIYYTHYILYTLYTIHTIYYTHYILYTLYTCVMRAHDVLLQPAGVVQWGQEGDVEDLPHEGPY
jgi:hypothetical protein